MNITDHQKRQVAITYLFTGYPIEGSVEVTGSFEELVTTMGVPDKLAKKAFSLEKSYDAKINRFLYLSRRKTKLFGSTVECPACLIIDWGEIECIDCSTEHAKISVVYEDSYVLNMDYIHYVNHIVSADEDMRNFMTETIHHDDVIADESLIQDEYDRSKCLEENYPDVYDDGLSIGYPPQDIRHAAVYGMINRPWSYATRITQKDTLAEKIKRAPKILRPLIKKTIGSLQESEHEVFGIHFSDGGFDEELFGGYCAKAPEFCILHIGEYECPGCHSQRTKYILITKSQVVGLEFIKNSGSLFEIPNETMLCGKRLLQQPSIH